MPIFKRTFSQDLNLLDQHLTKDILSQTDCNTTLTKLRTTFENTFNSEFKERIQKYTRFDDQSIKDALIFQALNVDALKVDSGVMENTCSGKENSNSETACSKSVKEGISNFQNKRFLSKEDLKGTRIKHGFKRAFMSIFGQDDDTFTSTMFLNIDQLQKQLDKDKFQEDGSMMQTQESKVDMGKALDADLVVTKSSGTESKVQDERSRSGNDTDTDGAYIRPIYDEEPMAENGAHCIALELKYRSQALKSEQHGQILNETSNRAKLKKKIDDYETINIELEHGVAKLLEQNELLNKENDTLKKHYKDLYDFIKMTRAKTIEQTTSLITQNADSKA
ncbi:hypothetical protein Tco_0658537 [Tanacetum coccineum]